MIETLRDLLLDYGLTESSDRQAQVEAEIWNQFGAERTVLIWDMSGFSLLTRRHGIVHYLSMVRRMQEMTRPIVHQHGGSLVKFEADNGFAVFLKAEHGIRAAIDMNEAFERENSRYPEEFDIRVSCGLDHGKIILLEGQDFFGDPVNTASKLGEDIATAGEILVTQTAIATLPEGVEYDFQPMSFSISGLQLEAALVACHPKPSH
jgi:class 3 adenylate cyclase